MASKLRNSKVILASIVAIYLALAVAYASTIPKWNAPDEPSHYNYVKHIAQERELPVLKPGDYDFDYLEKLKAARFPDGMPVDSIRYESHQPPLYYLLATPLFWATAALPVNSQVITLRLLSALFGALTILVGYRTLRLAFGGDALIPVAAAAFIASVPMHIHLTAAINNDSLANLLLSLVLLAGVSLLAKPIPSGGTALDTIPGDSTRATAPEPAAAETPRRSVSTGIDAGISTHPRAAGGPVPLSLSKMQSQAPLSPWERARVRVNPTSLLTREYVLFGVLLGLNLLTKTTASIAVVLVAFAVLVHEFRVRALAKRSGFVHTLATGVLRLARIYAVALAISGWWFVRNAWVYGNMDVFGLKRHDMVVVGQPLTGPFDLSAARHFVTVSFQSFWAQFGWMGILVDQRIYLLLWGLCALAGLGFALYLARVLFGKSSIINVHSAGPLPSQEQATSLQKWTLGLLALCLVVLTAGVIQYNLTYVQAQGRYFFPAIVPIATFFVLGIREIVSPRYTGLAFLLLFCGMFFFDLLALLRFILPALAS